MSTYHLEEGVQHTLTVDAPPWAISNHTELDFDYDVCLDFTFPRFDNSIFRSGFTIELLLERVNLKRQFLLSDSADDQQLLLTCIPHFLK